MGNIAEVSMTKLNLNRYFPGMTLIFQSNIIQIKQNALGIQGFIFHWGGRHFILLKIQPRKKNGYKRNKCKVPTTLLNSTEQYTIISFTVTNTIATQQTSNK